MKKFLFDKPDQNASDMTVFYGWEIVLFIVFLIAVVFFVGIKAG